MLTRQTVLFSAVLLGLTLMAVTLLPPRSVGEVSDQSQSKITWLYGAKGYVKSLLEQEKSGKTIFLYFGSPSCGTCTRLKHGVFTNPKVIERLNQTLSVFVEEDGDGPNTKLMNKFGLEEVPSLFVKRKGEKEFRPISIVMPDQKSLITPTALIQWVQN